MGCGASTKEKLEHQISEYKHKKQELAKTMTQIDKEIAKTETKLVSLKNDGKKPKGKKVSSNGKKDNKKPPSAVKKKKRKHSDSESESKSESESESESGSYSKNSKSDSDKSSDRSR